MDTTTQLLTSGDPESFLQQLSTSAKVDENMNAVLQQFQAEQANLTDLQRDADAQAAAAAQATAHMADLQAQGQNNVAQAKAVVTSLSSQQQAALAQVQSAQARVAAPTQAAPSAGASVTSAASSATPSAATGSVAPASSAATGSAAPASSAATGSAAPASSGGGAPSAAAAQALAYAKAHVGYPYVWAAAGPDAFDCSGLVVAAYASAGVSLPHSSLTLSGMGTPVSRADLRPGDLIFWYSPVHHVAIYEGNGMMVHAQNPSVGVVETPVDQWIGWGIYYAGARRVVG